MRPGCWASSLRPGSEPRAPPQGTTISSKTTERQVVREAQSLENYDPLAKQKAAAKLSRIPVKVEQAGRPGQWQSQRQD